MLRLPGGGDISTAEVARLVRFYLDAGAQTIMLGDTTGVANPRLVRERVGELMAMFPGAEFIAHFHDTRGTGVANSVAALELGLRYVDCSIGAIGGQPATGAAKYSAGYTGNTCSEDLLAMLEEMGVRHGHRPRGAARHRPPGGGDHRRAAALERGAGRPRPSPRRDHLMATALWGTLYT